MDLSLGSLSHRLYRLLRIDRRLAARDRPVALHRRRIFILPTRYGVLYGVLILVMLVGAANYGNSAGFLLGFLLAGMGIVSILHTYRNLAGLTFRAGRCPPVFAGDSARYPIIVGNPRVLGSHAVALQAEGHASFHDLAPGADSTVVIPVATRRRGRRPLAPITVVSHWPLGLFRAWSWIRIDCDCLVYPRPAQRIAPPRGSDGNEDGNRQRSQPGDDDFLGWRDYRPGDAASRVDWKAAARLDQLHTKQFSSVDNDQLWIDWALYPLADIEERLGLMCRAVLDAEAAGHSYGLRLPGTEIAPGSGAAQRHRCLEALALYQGPA